MLWILEGLVYRRTCVLYIGNVCIDSYVRVRVSVYRCVQCEFLVVGLCLYVCCNGSLLLLACVYKYVAMGVCSCRLVSIGMCGVWVYVWEEAVVCVGIYVRGVYRGRILVYTVLYISITVKVWFVGGYIEWVDVICILWESAYM